MYLPPSKSIYFIRISFIFKHSLGQFLLNQIHFIAILRLILEAFFALLQMHGLAKIFCPHKLLYSLQKRPKSFFLLVQLKSDDKQG